MEIKQNIIDIYYDRKKEKINKKYDKKSEDILNDDEYHKLLEKTNQELKEIFSKENGIPIEDVSDSLTFRTNRELYTAKTDEKIKKIYYEKTKEIEKLKEKCREVSAQIDLSETYEDKICIYINYGILNKNRKINA